MTPPEAAYNAQRHATRAPVDLPVRLQVDGAVDVVDGHCNNVSIGGMFVVTEALAEPGDEMRFELEIDADSAIRGRAEVVWRQPGDLRRQPGIGFKFRYLEQRDRQLIFKLVSRHIKDRLAARQPILPASQPVSGDTPTLLQRPVAETSPPAGPPAFAVEETPAAPVPADLGELSGQPPAFDFQPAGAPAMPPELPTFESQQDLELRPPSSSPPPSPPGFEPSPPPASDGAATAEAAPSHPLLAPEDDIPLGFDNLTLSPQELPLGEVPEDGPSILDTDDSLGHEYSEHLGDDHFEHRPAPRREWSLWSLGALVLLLVAALAYLFGGQLFELSSGLGKKAPRATAAGDTDGAAGQASQPAPAPPPAAAPPPASGTRRVQAPRAQSAHRADDLGHLEDVSFRRVGEAVEIVITLGEAVKSGSHDHFRLEGGKPREVVRLYGMRRFEGVDLAIGHAGVRRVRAGWHRDRPGGPQVHVVLDLDDPRAHITGTRSEGRRLIIRVES